MGAICLRTCDCGRAGRFYQVLNARGRVTGDWSAGCAVCGTRLAGSQTVAAAQWNSLARANGRGSAGQCPGRHGPKTPAWQEGVSRVAADGQAPSSTAPGTANRRREGVAA